MIKAVLKTDKHPFKKGEEFLLFNGIFSNGETCIDAEIITFDNDFELVDTGIYLEEKQ